jgi:hypothetical protein
MQEVKMFDTLTNSISWYCQSTKSASHQRDRYFVSAICITIWNLKTHNSYYIYEFMSSSSSVQYIGTGTVQVVETLLYTVSTLWCRHSLYDKLCYGTLDSCRPGRLGETDVTYPKVTGPQISSANRKSENLRHLLTFSKSGTLRIVNPIFFDLRT